MASWPTSFSLQLDESLVSAQKRFLAQHPTYSSTSDLDVLRHHDFTRLKSCRAYLDYTGATLYPESLVRRHSNLLTRRVLGNPHSMSPSSRLSSAYVDHARAAILSFFDADPSYTVIFTANSTQALRLVGESFSFSGTDSHLVIPVDAHNSVNGLREFAHHAGARVSYIPMGASVSEFLELLPTPASGLYVHTGQSNVSGNKYGLDALRLAKNRGYCTLLDAAALAPTSPISLRELGGSIDAMAVSLYKMIGYPTGVGALIVRKEFLSSLQKRWFSGGTVLIVQAPGRGRLLLDGHERWEDGTLNFLSLSPIPAGLKILHNSLPSLSIRLPLLMHFTLSCLQSIQHFSGRQVVCVHSPDPLRYSPADSGAVISFSILRNNGEHVPPHVVEHMASKCGIHLRAGCMCNPGAASNLLGLQGVLANFHIPSDLSNATNSTSWSPKVEAFKRNENMQRLIEEEGVIRVSFGLASSLQDASAFIGFVRTFIDNRDMHLNPVSSQITDSGKADLRIRRPSLMDGIYKIATGLRRRMSH